MGKKDEKKRKGKLAKQKDERNEKSKKKAGKKADKKAAAKPKKDKAKKNEKRVCPCCSKHCSLSKPKCSKGRRVAEKLLG